MGCRKRFALARSCEWRFGIVKTLFLEKMTTYEKYKNLQQRDIAAKTQEEFDAVETEMAKLADENPEEFEDAVLRRMKETLDNAKQLKYK